MAIIQIYIIGAQNSNFKTVHDIVNISYQNRFIYILKKFINNSRGKYKRNECLINVCKSDKDLS